MPSFFKYAVGELTSLRGYPVSDLTDRELVCRRSVL